MTGALHTLVEVQSAGVTECKGNDGGARRMDGVVGKEEGRKERNSEQEAGRLHPPGEKPVQVDLSVAFF